MVASDNKSHLMTRQMLKFGFQTHLSYIVYQEDKRKTESKKRKLEAEAAAKIKEDAEKKAEQNKQTTSLEDTLQKTKQANLRKKSYLMHF